METEKGNPPRRRGRSAFFLLPFSLLLFVLGCGVPGEPQPRRPAVPAAVTDLVARQRGETVELRFTPPARTTAGRPIEGALAVEVYRWFEPAGVAPDPARAPLTPHLVLAGADVDSALQRGRFELRDRFAPRELAERAGQQSVYLVRTTLRGRASVRSNLVALRVWPAPESPANLAAEISESAIALRWTPSSRTTGGAPLTPTGYRVLRAELPAPPEHIADLELSPAATTTDPAWRDEQFWFGRHYVYSIAALARYDGDEVESEASPPLLTSPVDVFPPAAPTGLVAIFVPAAEGRSAAVELSWSIGAETDLAGYHVYRSESAESPGQRLARELLLAPTFRDTQVQPGRRYFYSVAAADRAGNVSAPGAAVAVEIPPP